MKRNTYFSMMAGILGGLISLGAMISCDSPKTILEWDVTYEDAIPAEYPTTLLQTHEGGYLVIGASNGVTPDYHKTISLLKTDAHGNEVWRQSYDGSKVPSVGRETANGEVIIAGPFVSEVSPTVPFTHGVFLSRLSATGEIMGEAVHENTTNISTYAIDLTQDGGCIAAGDKYDGMADNFAYVVKLDKAGIPEWEKEVDEVDIDRVEAIRQTEEGGYILVTEGSVYEPQNSIKRMIKLDPSGSVVWSKIIFQNGETPSSIKYLMRYWIRDMVVLSDGGYLISGDAGYIGSDADWGGYVMKISEDGNVEWEKSVGDTGCYVHGLTETRDNDYIVVGRKNIKETTAYTTRLWVTKLSSNGAILFDKEYGEPGVDSSGNLVQATTDGGFVVAGSFNEDIELLKFLD